MITFVIDTMVGTITSLNLGQTSEVSKLVEQSMALVQFIVLGGIFGAGPGYLGSKTSFQRLPTWGGLVGLALALMFVLTEMCLTSSGGDSLANILWQALLFALWGYALGWLIRGSALAARASPRQAKMLRREAHYLGGTALGTLALSAAGLGFLLYNHQSEENLPVTGLTPPPEDRFSNWAVRWLTP